MKHKCDRCRKHEDTCGVELPHRYLYQEKEMGPLLVVWCAKYEKIKLSEETVALIYIEPDAERPYLLVTRNEQREYSRRLTVEEGQLQIRKHNLVKRLTKKYIVYLKEDK